jgi:tetratricopeptide (TPR) repeat protein
VGAQGGAVWPVRAGVVPPLADGFCVRSETAADLGAAMVTGAVVVLAPARTAGARAGGWLESCGKTQLAVCVAESLWQARRLELLIWVTCTKRASVLSGYMDAAVAVRETDLSGDGESIARRFAAWLGRTSLPWLVVLEDLQDMTVMDELWPSGPAGRVLVTTADPEPFCGDLNALVYQVGPYTPAEAQVYLSSRLGPGRCGGAAGLAADLGYEPLALAQAGAVIAGSDMSCQDYRDLFGRTLARARAGRDSPAAGSVTLAISAEQADQQAPGAARALLSLAAFLDGRGIPSAVFTTPAACAYIADGANGDGDGAGRDRADRDGADRDGADRAGQALRAAQQAGLLSVSTEASVGLVRLSQVVQAAVRADLPEEALGRAARTAADALLEAWPEDEQPAWLARTSRLCTYSLQRTAADLLWGGGCHPVLLRAGRSLDRTRLAGPAVTYWSELAEAGDRILGRGHPDALIARARLAEAYLATGQVAEAVSWFRWVLTERVRVLGPDHPSAITARRDLGRALMAASQTAEAATALERVVGDSERIRGPDRPETLAAQDELAAAYRAAGRSAEAVRLYQRTLAARERSQGPEHPDTMTTRYELAGACLADGKYRNALSQYKRALADREQALGPDHLDTIAVRGALGSAYHAAGRMASAVQLYEETRAAYQRVLGTDHPDTLASCANLARAYYAVGRVTDALALLRDTLARCEHSLAPSDPVTQTVRQSLADMTGG